MWTSWWTPATTALVSPGRYLGLIVALESLLDRHVDVVTLLRPSGCGKTTMRRMIGGFVSRMPARSSFAARPWDRGHRCCFRYLPKTGWEAKDLADSSDTPGFASRA